MQKNAHQRYQNPTIAEAICEIHFSTAQGKWEDTWLDEFSELLKNDYPNPQLRQMKGIRAELGENGVVAQQMDTVPRKILRHSAGSHLIQFSPNLLIINQLPTYAGWEVFLRDIETALVNLIKVCSPDLIIRVGLRYINKIPRKSSKENFGYWLAPSDYYPTKLQEVDSQFLSRLEVNEGERVRSIVTVAEGVSENMEPLPFLLDIDVIYDNPIQLHMDAVLKIIDQQHSKVWNIFSQSLTPALVDFLNGEEKKTYA